MRSPTRFLLLSLAGYAALFAIHLLNSLHPLLHGRVPPDLGYGAEANAVLQLWQVATVAYLFVVYGWALIAWRGGAIAARTLVPTIALLTVAAWALLPANSSDILEYLGFGRLFAVHGLNPYTHTYSEITDAFASYVTWDDPMPYGPPVLPLFALGGVLSEYHVLLGIYGLKLAWALVHLLNAWLVYRLATSLTADAPRALFAFACNPLVLLELVGNGHNDALLILCVLLALTAAARQHDGLALPLAFAAALVKLAGVFWVVAIFALIVRRRSWRALAWGSAACAASGLVVVLWPGCLDALTVLNSQWHYAEDSLHTIVINGLAGTWAHGAVALDYDVVFDADRLISSVAFAAFVLWRVARARDVAGVVRESGYVFLALVLAYAVSVTPWYFTWLLPIAVLTDSDRVRHVSLAAMAVSIALYAFPFATVETGRHSQWWAAARLIVALGAPLAFLVSYPAVRAFLRASRLGARRPELSPTAI